MYSWNSLCNRQIRNSWGISLGNVCNWTHKTLYSCKAAHNQLYCYVYLQTAMHWSRAWMWMNITYVMKCTKSLISIIMTCTKCNSLVVNTPASYSEGPRFKPRYGDQLSWQFSWVSLVPPGKCHYSTLIWLWLWSCHWDETISLNCGHQWTYCSPLRWYMSMENHSEYKCMKRKRAISLCTSNTFSSIWILLKSDSQPNYILCSLFSSPGIFI
jgi:hypothetical protein